MKNDLQLLIETLQQEKDYLETEMNSCIEEWDFEGAEAFKAPLIRTQEKLTLLKNLSNPDFEKISRLKNVLKQSENWLKLEEQPHWIQNIKNRVEKAQNEIERLEAIPQKSYEDNDQIYWCLEGLHTKWLKSFELIIEDTRIHVDRSSENTLQIIISRTDRGKLDHAIGTKINKLEQMGFQLTELEAITTFTPFNRESFPKLIELLARVVFEVLGFFDNANAQILMTHQKDIS